MEKCRREKKREGKTGAQRPRPCGTSTVTKWKEEVKTLLKRQESKEVVNQDNGASF